MAKAPLWGIIDAEMRKLGEQTGLDKILNFAEVAKLNRVSPLLVTIGCASSYIGEVLSEAKAESKENPEGSYIKVAP